MPQAAIPGARLVIETLAAELMQVPPAGTLATSLTTIEFGTAGVRVLLIRSCFADRETNPFGVTGQEQQEMSCYSCTKSG